MASHKVLGVVTRAVNYRDHDRILTLVTRERGKLTATARGCRKPQSKLLTASSPLCYGEYVLNERNKMCIRDSVYTVQAITNQRYYSNLNLIPQAAILQEFCVGVVRSASPELLSILNTAQRGVCLLYTSRCV